MKSFGHLGEIPSAQPLPADDITELHAGRLLMLLRLCGTANRAEGVTRIEGLTKLAKLDFFVRYPEGFNRMADHLEKKARSATDSIESPMVRHHYGPWDKRYYQILAFLEARGLIRVKQDGSTFLFDLMPPGKEIAERLLKSPEFLKQGEQMKKVKRLLGGKSGNTIKKLIYDIFEKEVTHRPRGEVI